MAFYLITIDHELILSVIEVYFRLLDVLFEPEEQGRKNF